MEITETTFTPEQRQVLGRLYGFLIQLGQQRIKRLNEMASQQDSQPEECPFQEQNCQPKKEKKKNRKTEKA